MDSFVLAVMLEAVETQRFEFSFPPHRVYRWYINDVCACMHVCMCASVRVNDIMPIKSQMLQLLSPNFLCCITKFSVLMLSLAWRCISWWEGWGNQSWSGNLLVIKSLDHTIHAHLYKHVIKSLDHTIHAHLYKHVSEVHHIQYSCTCI